MSDYISRADAINAVHKYFVDKINNEPHEIDEDGDDVFTDMKSVNALLHHNKMVSKALKALPSAEPHNKDAISREGLLRSWEELSPRGRLEFDQVIMTIPALPSTDAEPKWNCTANFIAEQLDRLRNMTDEEKWNFFREFFGMGDAVQGEWLPIEETLPTYDGGEKTWLTGMKCSNCGKLFDLRVGYYYCPSCGTRMKGGAE